MSDPARHHPRWGYQTSLFQWRQPAFYLFVLLLGFSIWFGLAQWAAFIEFSASGFALSWGLLLIYAVPVFALIYALDLYEREPPSLLVAALLWGAFGATTFSILGNTGWGFLILELAGPEFASRWTAALTAPFVEEILKAVGVIFIYLIARSEIDDIMDGFVYGAIVGLGFTLVEDVFYFIGAFGGTTEGVLTGFYLRVVASGLYGHVLYTGLTGMGIAYFTSRRATQPFGRRFGMLVFLFAAAILGHFVWNSPLLDFFPEPPWSGTDWLIIPLATAVKGLPLLIFVYFMVRMAHRREHQWLEVALTSEVAKPGLTEEELATLLDPAARRRARRDLKRKAGPGAARALKKLHREQINLAMIRTRTHDPDHPDLARQHEYCASLREWGRKMSGASGAPAETDGDAS